MCDVLCIWLEYVCVCAIFTRFVKSEKENIG